MLNGVQGALGPVSPSPEGYLGISACLQSGACPVWCRAGPAGAEQRCWGWWLWEGLSSGG